VDEICSPQTKSLTRCKVFGVLINLYLVSNKQQEPKKQKKIAGKKTKQGPQKQTDGVKKVRNLKVQG
jgi:hypothetical protein